MTNYMAWWMLEYAVIISQKYKYKFPLEQIVIYIGKKPLDMRNAIKMIGRFTNINYSYKIVDLSKIESQTFLTNDALEVFILAVLAKKDNPQVILQKVLTKL